MSHVSWRTVFHEMNLVPLIFRVVFNQLTVDVKPKSVLTGAIIAYGSWF